MEQFATALILVSYRLKLDQLKNANISYNRRN